MFYEEIITFLTSKGLSGLVSKGLAAFIITVSITLVVIVLTLLLGKLFYHSLKELQNRLHHHLMIY